MQNSIDSISYALAVSYDSEELIPQLNLARRSFVDKSNVTPTGRLYSDFTTLLVNLNDQLQKSIQLKKDLIVNNKVIDSRESIAFDATFGAEVEMEIDDFIPKDLLLVGRDALDEDLLFFKNHGFFYINYKNLIDSESNIASVFNMQKLYSITPTSQLNNLRKLLYNNFYIKKLEFKKYSEEDSLTEQIIQYTKDSETNEITNTKKIIANNGTETANIGGNLIQTYISQRNFSLINGDSLDDYSLMCFEFQDIDENPGTETNIYERTFNYSIGIEIQDETKKIAEALIKEFNDARQPFKDYVKLAKQICSYNNIDDRFNDFFIKQINLKYQNGISKPWLWAPTIYNLWRYLFTDQFADIDEAHDDARKIVTFISPETGTLDQLTTFAENFESFFESSLSEGSDLQNLLNSMSDGQSKTYLQEITVLLEAGKPLFVASAWKGVDAARDEMTEASVFEETNSLFFEWTGKFRTPDETKLGIPESQKLGNALMAELAPSLGYDEALNELDVLDSGGKTVMGWINKQADSNTESTRTWYLKLTGKKSQPFTGEGTTPPDPLRVGDVEYEVTVYGPALGMNTGRLLVTRRVASA